MVTVPIELVIKILEEAYHRVDAPSGPDYVTLLACTTVSSSWKPHAQQLLFRSVSLDVRGEGAELRNKNFLRAIDSFTDRGRILASWVRNLSVVLSVSTHGVSISPISLINILTSCSRLYGLVIQTQGLYELNPNHFAKLKAISTNITIRSLKVIQTSVQSPVLFQLLSIWSSVRFLMVGSEMAIPPPPKPSNLQLYELVLQRTPTEAILNWFLSTSLNTLRILTIFDPPSQNIRSILSKHAPYLKSLRLSHYNANTAAFLRLCVNLDELVLAHVPDHFVSTHLATSIEHFGFFDVARGSLKRILSVIIKLPNLRALTCTTSMKSLPDFHALQAACDERGVRLRTDTHLLWMHDDLVPVRRFPRSKSVSNFYLMN